MPEAAGFKCGGREAEGRDQARLAAGGVGLWGACGRPWIAPCPTMGVDTTLGSNHPPHPPPRVLYRLPWLCTGPFGATFGLGLPIKSRDPQSCGFFVQCRILSHAPPPWTNECIAQSLCPHHAISYSLGQVIVSLHKCMHGNMYCTIMHVVSVQAALVHAYMLCNQIGGPVSRLAPSTMRAMQ